ncbi:MAG: nucleotidyltransferase family protein [Gemmatimonadales bacterium]
MTPDHELLLQALTGSTIPAGSGALLAGAVVRSPRTIWPWLLHRIEKSGSTGVLPDALQADLHRTRRNTALLHLQQQAALRRIATAFAGADIPVLVLKGMALAHLVYPVPSLRPMSDVDLWVHPEDLPRADSVLKETGFRYPERTHDGRQLPTAAEALVERSYELPGTPVLIEVHGSVKSFASLGPDRADLVWRRGRAVELGGIPVTVPCPADLLLHVALHAADQHRFSLGLGPLVDVDRMLHRWGPTLDWGEMVVDWERHGVRTWMSVTLRLARDLLGSSVPDGALLASSPARAELYDLALEQIWLPNRLLPGALERMAGATGGHGGTRWLLRRLGAYWEKDDSVSWWRYPAVVAGRVAHDLTVKAPRYARGWLSGEWRGREAMARKRGRIGELGGRADGRTV